MLANGKVLEVIGCTAEQGSLSVWAKRDKKKYPSSAKDPDPKPSKTVNSEIS